MATLRTLSRLARRNVLRNRKRSAIVVTAVGVGLWAMLTFGAVTRGWEEDVVHGAINTLTGHLQIHARGYLDDPSIDHTMPPPDAAVRAVLGGREVAAWATRVRVPAVVMSERETAGVTMVGIEESAEAGLSFIAGAVRQGRGLASPGDDGILLGRALAGRLGTGLGKRVVLMSQGAGHTVADRGFVVRGIYEADREATEMAFVFVGREVAQRMLGLGSRITEVSAVLLDQADLPGALARLRAAAPGLDVEPWTRLEPFAQAMVTLGQEWIWMFWVVMYVAMAFGLVNTMLMAVLERRRELAMLQALGMRARLILGQVLLESCHLLAAGIAGGLALTAVSLALMRDGIDLSFLAQGAQMWGASKVIFPSLRPGDAAWATGLVVALGLAASLYPAWRASRRIPVEAMTRP